MARRVDHRFLLLHLDVAEVALARSRGDLDQARDLLDSAKRLARESGSRYERGLCQMEAGRLALTEGNAREAVAQLEEAARHFDDGGQRVESARAHLYLAVACQEMGDEKAARAHLERAFHQASALESQHILVVSGREAKELLEIARGDPALGHQASKLLKQIAWFERNIPILRRSLRRQTPAVPLVPPRLTIYALGRVWVELDGEPVEAPEWQSRQGVRDLLFLLLAHPEGLTKEQVGLTFWPDSSPSQLKLRFKNNIYRLRRALGQDVILFDDGCYRFNWALDYEYDVEAFWRKMTQAQAATDPGEQAALYQQAIELYAGPYLPQVQRTWVLPERERLCHTYVEATLKLAEFCLETSESETALAYCRNVLAEDPSLEGAHCLAMRAHAAIGNRAAIARQFELCRQALLQEIDASPSLQTRALYDTLMQ
jgi:DNA-binding SARP family transcriptional activator